MPLALSLVALAVALAALVVQRRQHARARRRLVTLTDAAEAARRAASLTLAAAVAERLRASGITPRYPVDFRADFSEDVLLYHLFEGRLDGTCVECGAFDGLSASTTYALDAIGWRAVLIEASPSAAAACARNRPRSTVIHAAASGPHAAGPLRFVEVIDASRGEGGAARPNSFVLGADTPKAIPAGHRQTVVEVPRTTMTDALRDLGPHVDVAVIDVEGHEMDLFAGWDFSRCCPRVLVVEEHPPGGREALIAMLEERGMVSVARRGWNRIMVHASQRDLLARARLLMH